MITINSLIDDLLKIRSNAPLVHNITNYVVMNNTANALLALGASPVMAHSANEVEDMVKLASSLVINIGTLSQSWVDAMIKAGKKANERHIPVVLDPVGAGATLYRTLTSRLIISECNPSVIRGNASEIMSLTDSNTVTKGVESVVAASSAIDFARQLAKNTGAVVVISGPVDYIIDSQSTIEVYNGSPLMAKVTGMGCTATAIIGAFVAVNQDFIKAAAHAMVVTGIAGELAANKSNGPGSMQVNFLDELYNISDEQITRLFNVGL
jgi:hydroxyethylthiazole kinase